MNKPLKILYFVDRLGKGGIQTFLFNVVSNLNKNKFIIDFLVLDDAKEYDFEKDFKRLGCKIFKLKGIWIKQPLDYIKMSKELNSFFMEHNDYSILHFNSSSKNYLVLKYAKKYGIKFTVAHSHAKDFQSTNVLKKLVGNILKKKLCKFSDYYLACSFESGKWLFGEKIIQSSNFKIVKNGINYEKFKFNKEIRNKIRSKLKISNDCFVIGNVGRFVEVKNHKFLLEIFEKYLNLNKNCKLLLVGSGELEEEIKKLSKLKKIDKNVIFIGEVSNVNEYLQAMDCFVMPSLNEGLGIALIEAQASGLKCYASKNRVPIEAKISKQLEFIPLEIGSAKWASIIFSSNNNRSQIHKQLKDSGYDISDTVQFLENLYLKNFDIDI